MGEYYRIRGKNIYTERLGNKDHRPVLFIHGGPGGIGVSDFIKYQGQKLSENFYIIAPEQRGVWRSEEIYEDENITLQDIIDDFEELRKNLNIKKWSLLSHSFGGYLSVLYANKYPDSIESIIYESPSFDFSNSEKSLLKYAANELIKLGKVDLGQSYLEILKEKCDYREINKMLYKILIDLGENAQNFMWYGQDKRILEKIAMSTCNGRELFEKSTKTRMKLLKDWCVYKSAFLGIAKINKPSLLLKGKFDPITTYSQINLFKENTINYEVVIFDCSSHYIRIEEPDKYCETVTNYLMSK